MAANIGMSTGVPTGASSLFTGGSLADQVSSETEEQRRKRLQQLAASRALPSAGVSSIIGGGYGSALGSG